MNELGSARLNVCITDSKSIAVSKGRQDDYYSTDEQVTRAVAVLKHLRCHKLTIAIVTTAALGVDTVQPIRSVEIFLSAE